MAGRTFKLAAVPLAGQWLLQDADTGVPLFFSPSGFRRADVVSKRLADAYNFFDGTNIPASGNWAVVLEQEYRKGHRDGYIRGEEDGRENLLHQLRDDLRDARKSGEESGWSAAASNYETLIERFRGAVLSELWEALRYIQSPMLRAGLREVIDAVEALDPQNLPEPPLDEEDDDDS